MHACTHVHPRAHRNPSWGSRSSPAEARTSGLESLQEKLRGRSTGRKQDAGCHSCSWPPSAQDTAEALPPVPVLEPGESKAWLSQGRTTGRLTSGAVPTPQSKQRGSWQQSVHCPQEAAARPPLLRRPRPAAPSAIPAFLAASAGPGVGALAPLDPASGLALRHMQARAGPSPTPVTGDPAGPGHRHSAEPRRFPVPPGPRTMGGQWDRGARLRCGCLRLRVPG